MTADNHSIIRDARKRLSEIHALAQRTYLESERRKLREEEKALYARIDMAEREIREKQDEAQEELPI
jgi:F0F1-type ATP synthase membrane subunit b/b'